MKEFQLNWLTKLNSEELKLVLLEYRYLVHRFTPWLGLLVAKSKSEKVRQLLLPNLIEESGNIKGELSHLSILDNLLKSCQIQDPSVYKATNKTILTEKWFYSLFNSGNTYKGLCVIGPATEAISHQFLLPLYEAVKANCPYADMTYFDIHLSEIEDEHAKQIEFAIQEMQATKKSIIKKRNRYIIEGIEKHSSFWNNLHNAISQN